jgi:cob(I)alamin adenosyltransferase
MEQERNRVRISRVYTRSGDQGMTSLAGGQRLAKDAPRIASYGTVDELMAFFGQARVELAAERHRIRDVAEADRLEALLEYLQNRLFTLGGGLAVRPEDRHPAQEIVGESDIVFMEKACDHYNAALPPLMDFVLPGGTRTIAALHVCRTVCRRAERAVVSLSHVEDIGEHDVVFLNRLSDLLFILSRWLSHQMGIGEVIWRRGLPAPEFP